MNKIFCKNVFNRVICLLLAAVFLSSFPTGATALALCLDEGENHIVDQGHLYLADCHSSVEAGQSLLYEHPSTLAGQESNNCVDISLSNENAVNRPSEITLPVFTKVIFSYALPNSRIGFQQQIAGYGSAAFTQPRFLSPFINTRLTVVLLI
jgi:hypothetical protein